MAETFAAALAALDEPAALIEDWLRRHDRSPLRVPRAIDLRTLVSPAHGIAAALRVGLAEGGGEPGSAALREAEKLFAFAGGNLGMAGASAFDVCSFVLALRDALAARAADPAEARALTRLFDWLAAVAQEAYASSRLDALRLRYRDSLERGTPVVMLGPELPAALLVGEPEGSVLDAVFGRLLLAVVRAGARAAILDGSGLVNPGEPQILEHLGAFAVHPRVRRLTTVLAGLPPAAEPLWLERFGPGAAVTVERFEDAVARATAVAASRDKGP